MEKKLEKYENILKSCWDPKKGEYNLTPEIRQELNELRQAIKIHMDLISLNRIVQFLKPASRQSFF